MSLAYKLKKELPDRWHQLEMCTKDFTGIDFTSIDFSCKQNISIISLNDTNIESYMVFLIFAKLLQFPHEYKPIEKVLYEIPVLYNNQYICIFSKEKFGLKLIHHFEKQNDLETMLNKIKRASKISENLMKPVIEESINKGKVTIENQWSELHQRYDYFRKRSEHLFEKLGNQKTERKNYIRDIYSGRRRELKELSFNIQAMLEAYFSMQEHLMTLLLPFIDVNIEEETISSFIRDNWTNKFNTVFLPNENPKVMSHFTKISKIKELRNKYTHGGFDKDKSSFLVQVKGIGTIPVELSTKDDNLYGIFSPQKFDFKKIIKTIDSFEEYLRQSSWSRPIKIIESGLNMNYDQNFISKIKNAITSDESLELFLEEEFALIDRWANMDW